MLGVRLDAHLERLLGTLARRRKTSKSAIAREAIHRYLTEADLTTRAEEQSRRASQAEDPEFDHDDRGWTP